MKEYLETERLILRPFLFADAPLIFALNADPEVMKFLPKDEVYTSEEQAADFLDQYIRKAQDWQFSRWTVLRKSDQKKLGWCGLREVEKGEVDLGFRFLREYWGQGYATESGQRWLEYGFNEGKLAQIVAQAAAGNLGSQRVLTKLNFVREPEDDAVAYGFQWLKYRLPAPKERTR
ncbi:GNAT family N-acetyltransferase [Neolewinella aurantiaca]|uniref:GNAT family N-acetyltransferase n=1 Tax=Neolewinella aurantiaca TaxID=2602767 RepID=A0A5C7FVX4_9BACT|nr:GNAT family N-acetyltransferase [Neolewinella aurantiaca]TXF89759.1 GNAT family N-acetyltransferase [Neolewinella aurantiaca]